MIHEPGPCDSPAVAPGAGRLPQSRAVVDWPARAQRARDELAWYKRCAFGRRRERITEGAGQGHLFDLDGPPLDEPEDSATGNSEAEVEIKGHRRCKRRTFFDAVKSCPREAHQVLE